MDNAAITTPTCPGCHIGCSLASYQCGRGKAIYRQWRAGETIPERRPPWKRPHGSGSEAKQVSSAQSERAMAQTKTFNQAHGKDRPPIPPTARLMHMLNIATIVLGKYRETRPEHLVIDAVARHEGCATSPIIRNRAQLPIDELENIVSELVEAGLLKEVADEIAGMMYEFTDEGRTRAEEWQTERAAADATFVDALSIEEQVQLAELIAKMLCSSGVRMNR